MRISTLVLLCLVFAGSLFGLGYWLGQRSLQQKLEKLSAAVARSHPQPKNPLVRTNPVSPIHPMPPMPNGGTPTNASPEMKEFMQNRATLTEKMAELRQQTSQETNGAPDPKLFAQFQKQNAALLQRQRELTQIIDQQEAKNPIPTPPPLQVPPDASPQLKAYLTDRDQLMRDQIAFMNQHQTDDPKARHAAMDLWRQQNKARFQQLQQQAQSLAKNTPSPNNPAAATK